MQNHKTLSEVESFPELKASPPQRLGGGSGYLGENKWKCQLRAALDWGLAKPFTYIHRGVAEGEYPFQSQAASFKSWLHHLLIDLGSVPVPSSVI